MASGTISTRPQAESAPAQGRYGDFIQKRLDHTRRQVRLGDVVSSLLLLATASLVFFLAVAVLDHWVLAHGLGFIARLGLCALWVGGAGVFVWRFLAPPLANRINPVFAAQTIEQSRPTLKNGLINLLLLRSHPQDVAPVVYRAMEHRAAADLLKMPVEHAVDRGRVVHLAFALAAVVGVFALYLAFSPKNPLVSAVRVLWPWSSLPAPTRVHIDDVRPGDGVVFNDDHQEISAQVSGLRDGEEVAILFSTVDGQVVDDRIVMTRVDDANRYRCELPEGGGGFQQDTFYRITAGDATTPRYTLEVQTAPTIMVDRIDYHFPPYTEQNDRTIKSQGDIKALEGTQVTIHATANMDIQNAHIDLNCAGLQLLSMTTTGARATGQFKLALAADDEKKSQYDRYQILFTDTQGRNVRRPVQYHVDVDRDLPPDISISEPDQATIEVPEDGQRRIHVHAFDDYGLRHVTLQAECHGQQLGLPALLERVKPDKAWTKPFDQDYIFKPAKLKLKAGDIVRYWATADDNKEPRSNHSDSRQTEKKERTIHIVAGAPGGRQDSQERQQGSADQPQPNGDRSDQRGGDKDKTQQGQGESPSKADGSKDADHNSSKETSKQGGQESKPQDQQHGDSKDPGQAEKGGDPSKDKTSSNPADGQQGGEPNSGDAGDEPNKKVKPDTQQADAIKDILKDKERQDQEKQKDGQQPKPDQSNNGQKQDQKQDQKQNSSQSGGQKQDGNQGGKQAQGSGGDKKDQQGTGNQQAQGQQPQGASQQGGGAQKGSDAQDNAKSSPQGNSGGSPKGGSQPQGNKDSGSSSSPNSGSQGNEPKLSAGPKDGQNGGGQAKPDSKHGGGEQGEQNQPAGGGQKPEKQQSGTQQGKKDTGGGNPPNSEKMKQGGQGPGDESHGSQLAQNLPKPDDKKPSGGDSADGQKLSGKPKAGEKPKEESGNSSGGGQSTKSKPEEKQGGGQTDGGDKPKSGQGDEQGSNGGKKPGGGNKGNKGGTAGGEPGQKETGKTGDPTTQDSKGAPDPQTDNAPGEKKTGDSNNAGAKPNDPQSPGNSEKTSDSKGDSQGDRKGGGAGGGGGDQHDKKNGKGAAGSHSAADEGGSGSNQHGPGATSKKAGEDVRSADKTGSPHQEPGKGNGEKQVPADKQTAKNDEKQPQGDSSQNSAESQEKSSGGPSGAQSSQAAGKQGSGLPAGGSPAASTVPPPAVPQEPEGRPDAPNIEFSKKQVDLALEHLKDEQGKQRSELLDRLGWTKEEAERFVANMKKLKDSAQQSGSEGDAAKKAYNEFLKNLDLHPHGTQIRGGRTKTDDRRDVRDAGQMQPPSDWADLYRAYSRSTAAGQK